MCSKHLRGRREGDWVVAYRLHHGHPVQVPEDRDERRWLADYLVDVYDGSSGDGCSGSAHG